MDEEIILEQFGLTKIEAKVYVNLLKLGSTTTGPLIKKTELHRATVYDVLKRLMEKGLVSYITKEKTKYFEATNPEHFMDIINEEKKELEKKERLAKESISNLKKIRKQAKLIQNAHVFIGVRGVKTVLEDVLKYKENLIFGSSGRFRDRLGSSFYQFLKRKHDLGIISRHIAAESVRHTDMIMIKPSKSRFVPNEYTSPISTMIYGNNVSMFVWNEIPVAFVIESKETANAHKKYFDIMWNVAKK